MCVGRDLSFSYYTSAKQMTPKRRARSTADLSLFSTRPWPFFYGLSGDLYNNSSSRYKVRKSLQHSSSLYFSELCTTKKKAERRSKAWVGLAKKESMYIVTYIHLYRSGARNSRVRCCEFFALVCGDGRPHHTIVNKCSGRLRRSQRPTLFPVGP